MYYLRTKGAANAIQFTVDKTKLKYKTKTAEEQKEENLAAMVCSLADHEGCLMCSS